MALIYKEIDYDRILKEDIDKLEERINLVNKENRRVSIRRNMLKTGYILKYSLPFILTTGLTFGIFSLFGRKPFVKDSYDATAEIRTEIDNFGIEKEEKEYKRKHNFEGYLSYTSEWKRNDKGTYYREIKKYITTDIEENVIRKIVKDENIESLDDILGTPSVYKVEKKNILTEKDKEKVTYLEAIIYNIDENDFITITETNKSNIVSTTIWIITNLYANALLYDTIKKETNGKFKRSFESHMDTINEEYPNVDTRDLVRKLEYKKEQYKKYSK